MTSLTPKQIAALNVRLTGTCEYVQVRRWDATGRAIEAMQFDRSNRLIEAVKIAPGGNVTVLP